MLWFSFSFMYNIYLVRISTFWILWCHNSILFLILWKTTPIANLTFPLWLSWCFHWWSIKEYIVCEWNLLLVFLLYMLVLVSESYSSYVSNIFLSHVNYVYFGRFYNMLIAIFFITLSLEEIVKESFDKCVELPYFWYCNLF